MAYSELPLQKFIDDLAARTPVPGGGSASALAGALAIAAATKSARFTTENEKFKSVETQVFELLSHLAGYQQRFTSLMDEDIHAFAAWSAARHLPKNTPEEKKQRSAALKAANEEATRVPEAIVAAAQESLALVEKLSAILNPRLAGDLGVAAYCLEAAARGAAIQVLSNCAEADTEGRNAARRAAVTAKVAQCEAARQRIDAAVLKMLKLA